MPVQVELADRVHILDASRQQGIGELAVGFGRDRMATRALVRKRLRRSRRVSTTVVGAGS